MWNKLLIFAVCTILLPLRLDAQSDARIRRATALTSENVIFEVWVNRQIVKFGREISVNYKVTNKSLKTIYLVTQNIDDKIVVEDDKIFLPSPFVLVSNHDAYDYSFKAIKGGTNLTGRFSISASKYGDSQQSLILVGFGYVFDITGLTPKRTEIRDPIPYKALLSSRLRTLELGGLYIEINEKF